MDIFEQLDCIIMEDEADHATTLQQRRDERMASCGKYVICKIKANAGAFISYARCKDPRCPKCQKIRAEQMRLRVADSLSTGGHIRMVQMSKDEMTLFLKDYDKASFFRIPTENGDIAFVDTDEDVGVEIGGDEMSQIKWDEVAKQVPGRNLSGKLGKKVKKEKTGESFEVVTTEIVTASASASVILMHEVMKDTRERPHPKTQVELQELIDLRAKLFLEKCKENNIRVVEVRRYKERVYNLNSSDKVISEVNSINRKSLDASMSILLDAYKKNGILID